ncbi:MAG TPA: serine hydrolase domain-containing protein, partial [Nevskia sp.]|nr:serine hydrolase domain-containing protein [Nevskia sp.]
MAVTYRPQTPHSWKQRAAALDLALDSALEQRRIVGGLLLVMQQGEPVYQRAAGLADRESGKPVQFNTLFRYASLTKPIVTAALMALLEQGKLGVQDPVTRWLPHFRPKLASGETPVITLHHLLTHTAGLTYPFFEAPDGPYHRAGVSDGLGYSGDTSLARNIERLAGTPLLFAPGSGWMYSLAIDVLGGVIESATGETLQQAVARLVTEPLGMKETAFLATDPARLAVAYGNAQPQPERMGERHTIPGDTVVFYPGRALDPRAFPSGGAGMVGSAQDFMRFLEAVRGGGDQMLKPETAALMPRCQTGAMVTDPANPGWGFGYGGAVVTDPVAAKTPQSAGTWYWGGAYGNSWFV